MVLLLPSTHQFLEGFALEDGDRPFSIGRDRLLRLQLGL